MGRVLRFEITIKNGMPDGEIRASAPDSVEPLLDDPEAMASLKGQVRSLAPNLAKRLGVSDGQIAYLSGLPA